MANHTPPQLFLIDGYALIYRAFFAFINRPLRNSRGENTSAVWGVTNFLLRLQDKYLPDRILWVHDAGDSFRSREYPEYKSTRQKLDQELQADFDTSVERVEGLLEAMRIPLVKVDGYEADDVIGTLAHQGVAAGYQSVIVSGDKDFYQLIGSGISLLNPGRGGPAGVDEIWVDQSNATERLGVPPSQVVDYLALLGDSSDNVPGVKGIGEKGAIQLLTSYPDLDTILANAAEIPQKRAREALLAQADQARLSRRLVTIHTDVPVAISLDKLAVSSPDLPRLLPLLAELEFNSLVQRLSSNQDQAGTSQAEIVAQSLNVSIVDSAEMLPDLVARWREAEMIAFDTETSSLQPHDAELIGLSIATASDRVWYLPFGHRSSGGDLFSEGENHVEAIPVNLPAITSEACAPLRELLEDPAIPKAAHNLKYDLQVLRRAGVSLAGASYDSMLASFVLDPSRRSHGIDALSLDLLGRRMTSYTELVGKGKKQIPFAEVPISAAAGYCGADSATVLALRVFFADGLKRQGVEKLLETIELPLVPVLADMEWTGVAIDTRWFARLDHDLSHDLESLEQEIRKLADQPDLNLNSPRQLGVVLFEKLGLPVLKKTRTGPSTDAEVLEQLSHLGHKLPELILGYRELQKLKSTYVDVLPRAVNPATGRIHTSYNQVGTSTGRLASSDPNLQNIPVRTPRGEAIRRGFVPAPGWRFVAADYSQIELRLIAHLSGDSAFVAAFRSGGDIHRETAALIFGVAPEAVTPEMRSRAKTINFGIIYGQGPFALANSLGITQEEARRFISDYFTRFAGVRNWLDHQVLLAREQGYVETIFGRRRYIPEIRDRNFNIRTFGERLAQNTPLQGSAADLIKIAMIDLHASLPEHQLQSRILLQVHDELILESPEDEVELTVELVQRHMTGAATLSVPLEVSIGTGMNWVEAKH